MSDSSENTSKSSIKCPHCGITIAPVPLLVLKEHKPDKLLLEYGTEVTIPLSRKRIGLMDFAEFYPPEELCLFRCVECQKVFLFVNGKLVWPDRKGLPPHEQMPDAVKEVFEEAQAIHSRSPRAACALLRAAAERLVNHICPGGKGPLCARIAELDISPRCKQILTVARLTGNQAVHGNEIDFSESNDQALARVYAISKGINQVVDELIALPDELEAIEAQMRDAGKR